MSTPIQKLFDLSGRTAVITGGSRGLGLQIAESLGEAGARILLSSRKAADLEEAAAHLKAKGIDARWVAADASDPAQIKKVCDEAMTQLGQVDILVNNAGRGLPARSLGQGDEPEHPQHLPDEPGGGQGQHDPAALWPHH
jgi:NAD(P)-dependent dehydrogenase (short-subunit alcohol dehydrogenase family)